MNKFQEMQETFISELMELGFDGKVYWEQVFDCFTGKWENIRVILEEIKDGIRYDIAKSCLEDMLYAYSPETRLFMLKKDAKQLLNSLTEKIILGEGE